jgi:hypothetical protein
VTGLQIAPGAKKRDLEMLSCLALPLKPAALVTRKAFRTHRVGILLIRLGGPMEADGLARNKALGDVLTDEGFWLRPVLITLDQMIFTHRAAELIMACAAPAANAAVARSLLYRVTAGN